MNRKKIIAFLLVILVVSSALTAYLNRVYIGSVGFDSNSLSYSVRVLYELIPMVFGTGFILLFALLLLFYDDVYMNFDNSVNYSIIIVGILAFLRVLYVFYISFMPEGFLVFESRYIILHYGLFEVAFLVFIFINCKRKYYEIDSKILYLFWGVVVYKLIDVINNSAFRGYFNDIRNFDFYSRWGNYLTVINLLLVPLSVVLYAVIGYMVMTMSVRVIVPKTIKPNDEESKEDFSWDSLN